MRYYLIIAAAAAAALAVPTAASARPGFVTTSLNLRAGPGTSFPVVDTLPTGAAVNIHGCLAGYTWCDIGWRGERGWVAGRYLDFVYRGRRVLLPEYAVEVGFPIVAFSVGTYWGHYYRNRPFYHRRLYFERHYHHYRGHVGRSHYRPGVHIAPPTSRPNFVHPGFRGHQGHFRGGQHGQHMMVRPPRGGVQVHPGAGRHMGVHIGGGPRRGGGGHPHVRAGGHAGGGGHAAGGGQGGGQPGVHIHP